MDQPTQTINVKVLDPAYQTVANGTLGLDLDPNDMTTATGLLNLSGSIEVNNLELKGIFNYFSKLDGGLVLMGANVMLTGQSGDTPLQILLTTWGDTDYLLGYFFFGSQAPESGKPHIIAT